MAKEKLEFGHVGISVTNIDRSRHFYETLLGFTVMHESKEEGRTFLFLGDGTQVLVTLWQQANAAFDMANAGLHHLAFKVDSMDTVRKYQRALQDANVTFEYADIVAHGPGADSGGIFFYDPDGVRLEIFSPTGAKQL